VEHHYPKRNNDGPIREVMNTEHNKHYNELHQKLEGQIDWVKFEKQM